MRRLLLLALLGASVPALGAGDPAYLAELQAAARAADLAGQLYWHKLLLYRPDRIGGGVTSSVDAAHFFIAAEGKTDPQAELDATLASFFSDMPRLDEPPQCRVKGRYEWLKEKLRFDSARLPEQPCELYEQWAAALNPAGISLVFAANDLNSPATMYGHTLLRVDVIGQTEDERLLAHAVNYAAEVATDAGNQVGYIFQALVGGFYGEYSIYRYHERVRQYVRVNHRDLWEYPVLFTRDEMDRVFRHLWEMRAVGSDYLFFTENCAFMLLALLETAREDLRLIGEFDDPVPYVIPVDTIRAARDLGVLGPPQFRPSMARTLTHRMEQLSPEAYDWVLDYADGEAALTDAGYRGAAEQDRARMLEVANDYLLFRFQNGDLPRETSMPRSRALLAERSRIAARSAFTAVPVPAVTPDRGHESSRLAVGFRADEHHGAAVIRARGAYHDRLDPPAGFLPGGEIEFVDLNLLVSDKLRVTDLKLVSVQSLAPWDRAFKPWLWQAQGGLRRYGLDRVSARPQLGLGGYVDGGVGLAFGEAAGAMAYAFAIGSFDANADVDQGQALSAGLRGGLFLPWANHFVQQLEADWLAPISGGADRLLQVQFGSQWQFSARNGLRLLLSHAEDEAVDLQSVELRWQHYF